MSNHRSVDIVGNQATEHNSIQENVSTVQHGPRCCRHVGSDRPSLTPRLSRRRAFAGPCFIPPPLPAAAVPPLLPAPPPRAPLRFSGVELTASLEFPAAAGRCVEGTPRGFAATDFPATDFPGGAEKMSPPCICCRRAACARSCALPSPNVMSDASRTSSSASATSGTVSGRPSACRRASVAFAAFRRPLKSHQTAWSSTVHARLPHGCPLAPDQIATTQTGLLVMSSGRQEERQPVIERTSSRICLQTTHPQQKVAIANGGTTVHRMARRSALLVA